MLTLSIFDAQAPSSIAAWAMSLETGQPPANHHQMHHPSEEAGDQAGTAGVANDPSRFTLQVDIVCSSVPCILRAGGFGAWALQVPWAADYYAVCTI